MNLVKTDFHKQGIDALNTGLGIGNAMQKTKQLGIDRERQAMQDQQQNKLFGQKSQLNQQAIQSGELDIQQKEKAKAMGQVLTALNIEKLEDRNNFFSEIEKTATSAEAKAILGQLKGQDNLGQLTTLNLVLANATGRSKNKGEGSLGTVSPKDFTVESLAQYEKTRNIADLKRFSPKTITVAGVEHQLNPETQRWQPIIDARSEQVSEQAAAIAAIEADKQSRIDFAKGKTEWQQGVPRFESKINSAESGQKILDATVNEIKNSVSNWSTEFGASLSAIPASASRKLAKLLDTLKAHSAFSTLTDLKDSGGTLGAISEAELVLLAANLGSLDQAGDSNELLRVIDQISSSNFESIQRLRQEFNKTNSMYSGSFDDFNSGVAIGVNNTSSQNQQALQWAKSNPDDPRSGQILNKLGVQ